MHLRLLAEWKSPATQKKSDFDSKRNTTKIHEILWIWASLFFSGPTLWWMQIGNINVSEEKGYGGPDRHATTTRRTTCSNELCFLNALPMWRIDMNNWDVKRWSMWENPCLFFGHLFIMLRYVAYLRKKNDYTSIFIQEFFGFLFESVEKCRNSQECRYLSWEMDHWTIKSWKKGRDEKAFLAPWWLLFP